MDKAWLEIVAPGVISANVGSKCTIKIRLHPTSGGFNATTTINTITDSVNSIVWKVDPQGITYPLPSPPRRTLKFDIICDSVGSGGLADAGTIDVTLSGSSPEVDPIVAPLEVDYVNAPPPPSP
jgi:hypothetical protein